MLILTWYDISYCLISELVSMFNVQHPVAYLPNCCLHKLKLLF